MSCIRIPRIRIPRTYRAVLLGFTVTFIWAVAAAWQSGSPPRITQLPPSSADLQNSFPFSGFGAAVDIHGDTAGVGIPLYVNSDTAPTQSGRVGIFTLDKASGAWIRSGSLDVANQRGDERLFGRTVVLREHDAAVGSSGAVRVYAKTSQSWRVVTKLTSDAPNQVLGPVLAYDDGTLAVHVT